MTRRVIQLSFTETEFDLLHSMFALGLQVFQQCTKPFAVHRVIFDNDGSEKLFPQWEFEPFHLQIITMHVNHDTFLDDLKSIGKTINNAAEVLHP